ncbi:MAG TPA: winged helix-turn-helix domain-containing protein [Pyrinomonadaceae bacterium]
MHKHPHEIHYFDRFTLDLTRGSLQDGEDQIKLRPKSFEVLKYLVDNHGRLISKEELIHAVWANTAVTDDSLVQCLKDIRHALSDQNQQIIKTVHGRGYIFDSDVRLQRSQESVTAVEPANVYSERTALAGGTRASVSRETQPVTRLMVLPFRMLRPDREVDFLAFSVPDSVAGALSVLDSVIVRAPASSARYVDDVLELKRIAEEAQVEVLLTGTILSSSGGIRISCQLLEVPSGTVLWWHEPHVSMSDLFELQDRVVRGIVESLSLSLSAREHGRLMRDVPSAAKAFEFFLRGNELSRRGLAGFADLTVARDLYLECVNIDPNYAPAWAQLGRCYRLIGKGLDNSRDNRQLAESAFRRALDLNNELPLAHSQYAFLEAELGRAPIAMARLLKCAESYRTSPDLFVALVLCCRFCGLLAASVAAHERARELDPQIATSVSHTHYQLGNLDRALSDVAAGSWAIQGMTLGTIGRTADAVATFRTLEQSDMPAPMRAFTTAWRAMFEGNKTECLNAAEQCIEQYLDPEGVFYMGMIMAHLGETERALEVLHESMNRGFSSFLVLRSNPWLADLRATTGFAELRAQAETHFIQAETAYAAAHGSRILELSAQ